MNPLVLDFETYFDKDITLKKLNYSEYVPQAIPLCVSWLCNNQLHFAAGNDITTTLAQIPWDKIELVGHNLLFDALVLKHWYGHKAKSYCDTLGLARHHHPSLKHDLGTLAKRFCPQIPKLTENLKPIQGKTWDMLSPEEQRNLEKYNKNDVLITSILYDKLSVRTSKTELALIDHTIKLWLNPVIILDQEKAHAAIIEEQHRINQQLTNLEISRENIRSDRLFSAILQAKGYKPPTKWSDKQQKLVPAFAKTDSAFLDFYAHNPELQDLLGLKRAINSNIKENRTERLINTAKLNNGKVPVAYNYHGAFTGRFSGSNKVNLQNLPRGSILRDSLVAPDGYQFVVADLAQIEARVLAWLAEETQILDAFRNKRDLYSEVASKIYGKPINKKDHPTERFIGKSAALGLGYGMGAEKFNAYCALQGQKLTTEFTTKVVETYRTTYNKLPVFWNLLQQNIYLLSLNERHPVTITRNLTINNNYIILPSNRPLKYEGVHWDQNMWRLINGKRIYGPMLAENITQAIARDILVEQVLTIDLHWPIIMHTHDELIALVPNDQIEKATQLIHRTMTTPPTWARDLPLDVEIHNGHRYGDCK